MFLVAERINMSSKEVDYYFPHCQSNDFAFPFIFVEPSCCLIQSFLSLTWSIRDHTQLTCWILEQQVLTETHSCSPTAGNSTCGEKKTHADKNLFVNNKNKQWTKKTTSQLRTKKLKRNVLHTWPPKPTTW